MDLIYFFFIINNDQKVVFRSFGCTYLTRCAASTKTNAKGL